MTALDPINVVFARIGKFFSDSTKKTYNYWKQLNTGLKILLSTAACILSFAIIFFFISFNEAIRLNFSPTTEGVKNLTTVFDIPIKSFGAFLGIVTLFVAIKRMIANDQQVKIAYEQNRLSNYFKFRDEFAKHFVHSKTLKYARISTQSPIPAEEIFLPLFNQLYGSYKKFSTDVLDEVKVDLEIFLNKINNCRLNKITVKEFELAEEEVFQELFKLIYMEAFYNRVRNVLAFQESAFLNYFEKNKLYKNEQNAGYVEYCIQIYCVLNFIDELNGFTALTNNYDFRKLRINVTDYVRKNIGKNIIRIDYELLKTNSNYK